MYDIVLMWCNKTVVQMIKIHSLNSHTVRVLLLDSCTKPTLRPARPYMSYCGY